VVYIARLVQHAYMKPRGTMVSQCHRPPPRSPLAANQSACRLQTIYTDIVKHSTQDSVLSGRLT